MKLSSVLVVVAGLATLTWPLGAADWPQWRGPDRTGVSKETGLLKTWPKEGPKLRWTYTDAGVGYSGPAVVGDRLFTMGARGDTEYVYALDVTTGQPVWSSKVGPLFTFAGNVWGDGPRSTPTVDGELLYALGGQGDLVCVETATGKERWRFNLLTDLGGEVMEGGPPQPGYGYSESPLVDGNQLVCTPGGEKGTLAALDKKTGKVLWRSQELKDPAAYSSVVIAEVAGIRQYVQVTGKGVAGVAAKDGRLLWHHPNDNYDIAVCATPLVRDNHVYATAGYGAGCDLVKLSPEGQGIKAEQVYVSRNRRNLKNQHGGVVLVGDHVYGYSDRSWVCQDFKTGAVVWEENRRLRKGSLTCADGYLYCFSEDNGTVVLLQASPAGWKESGRFQIPQESKLRADSKTSTQSGIWTHPVVANGRLYLRDQELLFCYDIKEK
jgi:outer membrane protein assembly factor BamB